ncbi:hypothetical protein JG688_00004887, partial [Phytophthora aleatoria]
VAEFGTTTHSGPLSYLTAKTLPLDEQAGEEVKSLVNAFESSEHIANFLNENIGSTMGQNSAEGQMKGMLHDFRQLEGSDFLVILDQMDVTCDIVM